MKTNLLKNFTIIILLILSPILLNWMYLYFITNSDVANNDFYDPYSYLVDVQFSNTETHSYILNSDKATCKEITDKSKLSSISYAIRSPDRLGLINNFPGYGLNFFQIKLKYSQNKVEDYLKRFCNLNDINKDKIIFDDKLKFQPNTINEN